MLISESPDAERRKMLSLAKDQAAACTDEMWKWHECGTIEELNMFLTENSRTDISCLDLTIEGTLDAAKTVRRNNPSGYIILIADSRISPVVYMRPTINAESLLMKPLRTGDVNEVLREAFTSYVQRVGSTEKKNFLVENREGRMLIDYDRINFFESREKKVFLATDTDEYGFYDTLDNLENKLVGDFIRVHRSFLVNVKKINRVFLAQGRMVLSNGEEITISRSYKPHIRQYLEEASANEK